MVKAFFGPAVAIAATLFLAVGAAAGATVQHFNLSSPAQCFPGKGGSTFCVASTGEENVAQTPSGNLSAEINVSDSFVVNYNGAVVESGSDSLHEHVLYASGFTILEEGGMHSTSTFAGGGMTCTYSADVHVTDLDFATGTGHIQYSNVSFVCV
jgi:hypothetical protein